MSTPKSAEGDWAWGNGISGTNSESCLILAYKFGNDRLASLFLTAHAN